MEMSNLSVPTLWDPIRHGHELFSSDLQKPQELLQSGLPSSERILSYRPEQKGGGQASLQFRSHGQSEGQVSQSKLEAENEL